MNFTTEARRAQRDGERVRGRNEEREKMEIIFTEIILPSTKKKPNSAFWQG